MRQKFFLTPFAAIGDRETPPDAQQPDGSVSYSQGFGPDYAADPATVPTAKPVPRAETNGIYFDVTDAVRALQTQSAPEFITTDDNGGTPFPYDRGVAVRWSANGQPPFVTYVSRVNGNTAVPSNATNWSPLLFEAASNAEALAGSSSALIITPAALSYVLTQTAVSVPTATTDRLGISRFATNAEAVNGGAELQVAVTPPALHAAVASLVPSATTSVAGRVRLPTAAEWADGAGGPLTPTALQVRTALNGVQPLLGFTPVRQGGGSGQQNNVIRMGWTGTALNVQVDALNLGNVIFQSDLASSLATKADVSQLAAKANLAGDTFSGPVRVGVSRSTRMQIGDPGRTGFIEFLIDGTRLGYIGNAAAGERIVMSAEGGTTGWRMTGSLAVDGPMAAGGAVSGTTGTFSGAVTATGGFQGSSRTVKRDIRTVPGAEALAIVETLQAVSFEHKPEYRDDGGKRTFGFIAEDMDELLPEAVRHTPDGPSPLVIDPSQPTAVLWAALAHLAARVKELEDRNV